MNLNADPRIFEKIALSRLPELQVANGLFRATARPEGGVDEGPPPTRLSAAAVVLLGLLRAEEEELPQPFSTGAIRTRVLGELSGDGVSAGDIGLALWAESRAGGTASGELAADLMRVVAEGYDHLPLEQLAMVSIGLTEASVRAGDSGQLESLGQSAAEALMAREHENGLFAESGRRRDVAAVPVSCQFHALNALCQLIRSGQDAKASAAAQRLLDRLLELQRPDGSWPGLVDPRNGEAAALYPVLTVTQVALVPMALRAAGEQGLGGDLETAANGGLAWAEGKNLPGFDLVHETQARLDRGIFPKREPGAVSRGISNASRRLRGRLPELDPERLILDPAVSSEDLGWLLEAWAGR